MKLAFGLVAILVVGDKKTVDEAEGLLVVNAQPGILVLPGFSHILSLLASLTLFLISLHLYETESPFSHSRKPIASTRLFLRRFTVFFLVLGSSGLPCPLPPLEELIR